MATKQELEEQVVKLQAELVAAQTSSGADSAQSAKILELEEKLKTADEHCSLLEKDLEKARADVTERDNALEAFDEEHKTVLAELKVAQVAVLSQETEIKLLTEKKAADTVAATVVAKGRMSDIVDQWRKKEIDDDAEVLVFKPN